MLQQKKKKKKKRQAKEFKGKNFAMVKKNENPRADLNFQSKHALIKKWNYSCMETLIAIRFWSCNIVFHLLQKNKILFLEKLVIFSDT